jgi:mono/diheme cytochrome c family protein
VIKTFRDPEKFAGIWTQTDGSTPWARWVVTTKGVQVATTACAICHGGLQSDGAMKWGEPFAGTPGGKRAPLPMPIRQLRTTMVLFPGDSDPVSIWRQYTVPWAPDERVEELRSRSDAVRIALGNLSSTFPRTHGSPFYATKIPDLHPLRFSRYVDATGTHRLRGPEDVARYAAFVMGADPMEFGSYKILTPEQRRISFRYADEVLYAIGLYLMSLEPARNPNPPPPDLVDRGREVFARETCVQCHIPPNYTSGKLTLAQGFTPPADHPNKSDIANLSVGTDSGLATRTRKGTGFYKIPSLRGVWYRPALLHDGSVASLEEMFDPDRLKQDHIPGGWKGPGVTKRAIPGHPFGLALNTDDKQALLAFLRSL